VVLYRSEDGRTKLDVRLQDETVWLNQRQLTELFGKAKGTISEHIKHIFEDSELSEEAVVRFFRTTGPDGKQYEVAHYNLDMVIAIGFRVRSPAAVRFRQWAADKLKEYIVKGFVFDDDRLPRGHGQAAREQKSPGETEAAKTAPQEEGRHVSRAVSRGACHIASTTNAELEGGRREERQNSRVAR